MPAGAFCFSNKVCRAFVEGNYKQDGGTGDVGTWCTKSKDCRAHLISAYKASSLVKPKKDAHHAKTYAALAKKQNDARKASCAKRPKYCAFAAKATAYCFATKTCRDFVEMNYKHDGGTGDVGAWCEKEKDCVNHVLDAYKKSQKA